MKQIHLPLLAVCFRSAFRFHISPCLCNAKQKSYAKSFKIVLSLASDRMPTKPQLMNLGRIAYLINDLNSVNQCFILVIKLLNGFPCRIA